MNSFHRFLLALLIGVVGLAAAPLANAQSKIGHLDSDALIASLPMWKTAQAELETFATMQRKKLEDQELGIQTRYEQLQREAPTLPPVEVQKRQEALQRDYNTLLEGEKMAQTEVINKQKTLTDPIRTRVVEAIAGVAREKGYQYILDSSQMAALVLYANPADDISAFVRDKLK